jgi:ketosteroid isomerase-like protein
MIDRLTLHDSEILNLQTDGHVAMVQRRIDVSWFGHRFQTEVCDIWELDEDGKATALTQYVDTALLAKMVEAGSET